LRASCRNKPESADATRSRRILDMDDLP
jgi:hypothetical protein